LNEEIASLKGVIQTLQETRTVESKEYELKKQIFFLQVIPKTTVSLVFKFFSQKPLKLTQKGRAHSS
jgi:hypothetical protein